jgi:hypothetical protein
VSRTNVQYVGFIYPAVTEEAYADLKADAARLADLDYGSLDVQLCVSNASGPGALARTAKECQGCPWFRLRRRCRY